MEKYYLHPISVTPKTVFVDNEPRYDLTFVRPDTIGSFPTKDDAVKFALDKGWLIVQKP